MPNPTHLKGGCSCGTFSFETRKAPTARFICHCLFCQAFTGQPFSDVSVLLSHQIDMKGIDALSFKKYRLPPNLNRGRCTSCGQPAVETMGFRPLQLVFIPSQNFSDQELLPPAKSHVFYHRRAKDISDSLPKYSGYWPSQIGINRTILGF